MISGPSHPIPPPPPGRKPTGAVEIAVANAWCYVLGLAECSADDDFFGSGGHSISAMALALELQSQLGRGVWMDDILAGRTLAEIAARAAAAPPLDDIELVTGNPPALSPSQRRLWFLDKLAPGSPAYNIPLAERITGPLDVEALRVSLAGVARRHEVLRWRISDGDGGEPVVEVREPQPVVLDIEDATEQTLPVLLDAEATKSFDLAADTLWRARLFRLGPDDHVLALTFHHAVFDGWSQRPFYDDLSHAYRAAASGGDATLAALPAGFSDYVAWQAERDSRRGDPDLRWWREHLAGAPLAIDLPRDAARPQVQTYRGGMVSRVPSAEVLGAAAGLSQRLGATLPAVLLAGLCVLVRRLTGQADMVIGTPVADRSHLTFGSLVGFFVEVMPLRVRIDPAGDFAELAQACSNELLAALAHPAAPFERIVDALGVPRDPGRPPLVQVLFNVYNFPEPRLAFDGLATRRVAPGLGGSPFDLTVYVAERDRGHAIDMVYNPDLFLPGRVQAFVDCYLDLLDVLTSDPGVPVGAVRMPRAFAVASGGGVTDQPRSPAPGAARVPGAAEPPSRAEHTIASIWREVLELPEVSVTANFFDAGGSSLALIAVRARIAERLGRELSVAELFQYPTIRALAGHLQGTSGSQDLARAAARAAARRQRSRRQEPARRSEPRPPRPDQGG